MTPRPFTIGARLVRWSKLEDGFYFARFRAASETEAGPTLPVAATLRPEALATFRAVAKAAAKDAGRFAFLNGVRIEPADGGARFVACDGKRMHVAETTAAVCAQATIVPRAGFAALVAGPIAADAESIRFGGFAGKPPSGKFPSYEAVIPRECPTAFAVDSDSLRRALAAFGKDTATVGFAVAGGALTLHATRDGEEATARLTVRQVGPDLETGFDPRFVLDAAAFVASRHGELRIGFSGATTPARFESDDEADRCAVVMPRVAKA